jgi:hypothetical protein
MSESFDADRTRSNRCYICIKSLALKKKFTCNFCSNSVCAEHYKRTRFIQNSNETKSICDLCDQNFIRKEIEIRLDEEIKNLSEEVKQAKIANEKLERDYFEKTTVLGKIEDKLEQVSKICDKEIKVLQNQLAEEETKTRGNQDKYSTANELSNNIQLDQKLADEKLKTAQKDLENVKTQSDLLKSTKNEISLKLEKINNSLRGSLSIEQVKKILCPPCSYRLEEISKERLKNPSILEDGSVILSSADAKKSIIESVRDYKDILLHQSTDRENPSNCTVF